MRLFSSARRKVAMAAVLLLVTTSTALPCYLIVSVNGLGVVYPESGPFEDGIIIYLTATRTGDPSSSITWSGTDNDASTESTNTVFCDDVVIVTVTFTEPSGCNDPAQDTDGDGDVDLADFAVFSQCFNGPNRPYAVSSPAELVAKCECLDQDGDSDVDLADFGVFSACFNGPNRVPAVSCP